ncbi:MAG: DUF6159 family protein [Pseudomonadota bacterium]
MFKTLSNSWALAKECWEVLMHDKEMLVYPILTSIVNIAIMAIAYFYLVGFGFFETETAFNYSREQWIVAGMLAVATIYACHFSFSFFECALVASAIKRLGGENPTLSYGLGIASDRIPQIAGWSFFVTIFGLLLAAVKSLFKSRWAQKAVGGIAETAWNVVTVFVLPLIIVKKTSAFAAVKQSATLVKQKWGEAATLEIGFGSLTSIAAMPLAGLFMLAGFVQSASEVASMAIMAIAIVLAVLLGIVFAALSGISKAVLYNFATNGNIPDDVHGYTIDDLVVREDRDPEPFGRRT